MTDALRAKIALDGGDDVRKQLAAIGDAGKQAFQQTQQAAQSAGNGFSSVRSAIAELLSAFQGVGQQIASIGDSMGKAFNPLISAGSEAVGAITKTGAGFGALAGAAAGVSAAIGKIGQEAADSVAKLSDAAEAVGLTSEKYRGLKAAFAGLGVDANVLDRMVEASDKAALQAEVKNGGRSHIVANPFVPADESDAGGAGGSTESIKSSVDGLKTSVLGAEREMNNLPTVWKAVNGQLQQVHPELGAASKGLAGYGQAAAELGVALQDMYGKARPGIEVARDVVLALSRMSDGAKRTSIAIEAFGKDAQGALKIADNPDAVQRLLELNERAGVGLTETQKKLADEARRTNAVLADAREQWSLYFRSLATPVTIDQNNAILGFLEQNKAEIKDFGDNVVGPAIRWLGQFQNAFGVTAVAAGGLGAALGLLSPLTVSVFGAAGIAAIAFGDDVKNGAVAAMAELSRIVKANDLSTFAGWKNAALAVWEDIRQTALDAWNNIRQRIASVDWASVWVNLKAAAAAAWDSLRAQVAAIDWAGVWASVKNSALAAWEWLKGTAIAAWGEILTRAKNVDFSGIWDDLKAGAQAAWDAVVAIAQNAYVAIRVAALDVFPGLADAWSQMEQVATAVFESLKGVSAGTWIAVAVGLVGLLGLFRGTFSEILLLAAPFWRQILAGAETLFPGLRVALAPLSTAVSEAFAGAETVAGAAWAYIRALLGGDKAAQLQAWGALAESAGTAWAQIRATFSTGYAAIRAQLTGSLAWLAEPWEALEGAVVRTWQAIKAEHEAGYPTIKGIWDNLVATWQGVKGAADLVAGAINLIFRTNYSGTQLLLIAVFLQLIGLAPVVTALIMGLVVSIELFTAVIGAIPTVIAVVGGAITGLAAVARGLSAAFLALSATPWGLAIIAAIVAIGVALYELYSHWDQVKAGALAAWNAIRAGATGVWDAIKGDAEAFFAWLEAKWEALKSLGGSIWDKFKTGALGAWEAVKNAFTDSVAWIETKWNAMIAKIKSALAAIGIVPGASSKPANDNSSGSSADSSGSGDSTSPSELPAYAAGGLLSGPGTGTSDSIFAMLSNGEFVMSAKAVQAYGADLFHSLNNLAFPGFALGGFVGVSAPVALPRFADGGVARQSPAHAGMIAFTLDQGGRTYDLMGSHDTVRDLQRHSVISRMASTTKRAPSWNNG